jgi:hypothetical protein
LNRTKIPCRKSREKLVSDRFDKENYFLDFCMKDCFSHKHSKEGGNILTPMLERVNNMALNDAHFLFLTTLRKTLDWKFPHSN